MERLWAPWRMKYISAPKEKDCFLCRAWEAGEKREHRVLARGRGAFVIMNTYPYNNGHLMVATAAHVPDLESAGREVRAEIMELLNASLELLGRALKPHGFNVGVNLGEAAGAGVADHLHVHVVPRWTGDTNYMPVTGDVKVISEHIDDTYVKLINIFESLKMG